MKIYTERNKGYGDNYLQFGDSANLLFEHSKCATVSTPKNWNRLALIFHIWNKLSRYCKSFDKIGGHKDSLEDLIIYAIMLREVDSK